MPERVHRRFEDETESKETAPKEQSGIRTGPVLESSHSKKRKRHASFPALSSVNNEQDHAKFQLSKKSATAPQKVDIAFQHRKNLPKVPLAIAQAAPDISKSKHESISAQSTAAKGDSPSLQTRARALWPLRKALPIWSHSIAIRHSLREKDVLLLVGETGSGKSTQVPQMLAREPWSKNACRCIAVTEPRRVAAISLARRVAEESASPLGSSSPASTVGYSVRFDNSTGPNTRIKFLTEGMLLQEILRDPMLMQYSAVVVDEVHERGVNVDLVLGFLRRIVERRRKGRIGPLRVCVMSATADMELLSQFFREENRPNQERPLSEGMNNGVKGASNLGSSMDKGTREILNYRQNKLSNELNCQGVQTDAMSTAEENEGEEYSDWSGISTSENESAQETLQKQRPPLNSPTQGSQKTPEESSFNKIELENAVTTNALAPEGSHENPPVKQKGLQVDICHIEGRQFPVKINYVPEPVQDIVEASLKTIFQIHYKEPLPGDVLVFLTGQETVESLTNLVIEYSLGMSPDLPKIFALPLFAALPQAAQQLVFEPAPPRTRKIIISTNIAETSITVPGVRFVIDCGKAKVKQFRTKIGLESLLVKPISKSAAIQRKGRAGREAPGQCYRLYTEKDYLALDESNTPEILRCDLSHTILTIRARGVEDVLNFPFLNQPPREAMEKALLHLWMLGALTDSGAISEIGSQIARFPLSVSLGRALIAAAEPDANCVIELIDIIACLSVENVFFNLNSEEKRDQAENARRELYKREGDHLTLLATVQAYAAEDSDRKAWADRHFVSHRAMRAVMDVRKQLRTMCQQMEILSKAATSDEGASTLAFSADRNAAILKSFLKGFAMNTAALCPDGSYKTFVGKQTVAIHPSSVLFGRKVEAIMFNEFVFTKKSYARGVSAVQLDWVAARFPVE